MSNEFAMMQTFSLDMHSLYDNNYATCILIASLTGQIAVEVTQFTEAKRKHCGKHVQPKVGLSPLQRGAGLRSTRSTSLRKKHDEKQAQLNAMKVNNFHLAMIKINHNHYALCFILLWRYIAELLSTKRYQCAILIMLVS